MITYILLLFARFVDVCSLSNLLSTPVAKVDMHSVCFFFLCNSYATHLRSISFFKESNHKLLEELAGKPKSVSKLTFSESDFKFKFANEEGRRTYDIWNASLPALVKVVGSIPTVVRH